MQAEASARGRQIWGEFRKRKLNLTALIALGALAATAGFADQLASDKPIAVRVGGETYWFPNLTDPLPLRELTNQSLRGRLQPGQGEWMIEPLIPFGPHQTFSEGDAPQAGAPPWPPGAGHPLGTDEVGRDVAARIIHGARVSLTVGLVAVGLYVLIGLLVGALAGFYGGVIDALLSRFRRFRARRSPH